MNEAAVTVEGLSYQFPGRSAAALDTLSFTLTAGSWNVVAGRTGSGKSTLLRALCGLIPRHARGVMTGSVRLFGHDTRNAPPAMLAQIAGMVLQSPDDQICTTSPSAEIAFGLENLCLPADEIGSRVQQAIEQFGLGPVALLRTHQLSGGQKQRLMLASVMAMRPKVLLLDEPLSQLDAMSAWELLEEIARLHAAGTTIVMVEHRLDDVLPRADRVLLLDRGRLAADVATNDLAQLAAAFRSTGLELPELAELAARLGHQNLPSVADLARTIGKQDPFAATVAARRMESVAKAAAAPRLVEFRDVAVQFEGQPQPLWKNVSFSLFPAECVALVGGNGSGKSTLVASLAGLIEPSQGEIRSTINRRQRGLVLQNADLMLFCDTVRDELAFAPRQLGCNQAATQERVTAAAAALSLEPLLDEPPLALSQGQRLRVALAAMLSLWPKLVMLDEPTTGQDHPQVFQSMAAIVTEMKSSKSLGTVLFSTHDLRFVIRFADRVLVLGEGRLLADCSVEELLADDALLDAARLRRTPLEQLRRQAGLRGHTIEQIVTEVRP